MYDLNQPNDVLAQFRDADMTDDQIITVCKRVLVELKDPAAMHPLIGDWCAQDVRDRLADVYSVAVESGLTITDDEAEGVLMAAENNFDWETMDYYIDQLIDQKKAAV